METGIQVPDLPIPPYRRAVAAISDSRLSLAYNRLTSSAQPGEWSTGQQIQVAGAPFSKPYFDEAWSAAHVRSGKHAQLSLLVEELSKLPFSPPSVTFCGGEPLMQSNSVRHLSKLLKAGFPACKLRVNTTGYYSESIGDVGKVVDCISLEILAPLSPEAYAHATNFSHDPILVYSAVQKALAFLKLSRCRKEVCIPVAPGLNDCPDCLAQIAHESSFADLLVVKGVKNRKEERYSTLELSGFAKPLADLCPRIAVEAGSTMTAV